MGQPSGTAGRLLGDPIAEGLQAISALSQRVAARLAGTLAVNSTDLAAMEHLLTDGPLTSSQLAERLGVTTASSTHVVDRLEAAGHASRRPHPTDRRKNLVVPAAESAERAFRQLEPLLAGLAGVIAELSPADRVAVEAFLGRVVAVYTAAAGAPPGS